MGDILTFTPRPKPAAPPPPAPEPLSDAALRDRIEAAAEVAVDTAERLIAILDRMDRDPDLEDGGDDEPSLAAPENHDGSQVGWCRENDGDREAEAPEIALPEVIPPEVILPPVPGPPWPLPWSGRANVVTVAAVALLDLIERAG